MSDRGLPTGTITFLFSDIEGSTRLVQDLGPAAYTQLLEQHNRILRQVFERHGGTERGTQGDSFLVMFREAPAAVEAAANIARRLAESPWPDGAIVRLRMGLHTGVGVLGGDDYVGIDVHRAARVASAAHGGQILLSAATRALVDGQVRSGLSFRDLGEHRLRDLARSERLHQLVVDGLPSEFPAPRTTESAAGNLPARVTSFIGREGEIAGVQRLLESSRLVTLTGAGGTGKTSLAIEAVREIAHRYPGGTWFAPLEAIRDPSLVAATIMSSLGLEGGATPPLERLRDFLGERSVLLLIDNFEQVLDAAPVLGQLLQAAPGLTLVVTSRAPLRLAAEQEFPVAPLAVPGEEEGAGAALATDAIRLWIDRASRARPGYRLAPEDVAAVADICRRLDGLPLGIELAAARAALLPPSTIAERLGHRLDLPGTGARDLPERQRTLASVIGWSYDLLGPAERRLLDRLGIFAGGSRLEEAEAVCGPREELGVDVLDGLSTLADHSLVEPTAGPDGPRFRLLTTVRMFAAERLRAGPDAETIGHRHADAYLAMVEDAAPHFPGRGQVPLLERLAADHDNIRAAVNWVIEHGDVERALRFGGALWRFWQMRGYLGEGSAILERILAMPGGEESRWRPAAVGALGSIAWWQADLEAADRHYAEQVRLARRIGEPGLLADALFNYAHAVLLGPNRDDGHAIRDEAKRRYEEAGDVRGVTRVGWIWANVLVRGDMEGAEEELEDLLERFRAIGDDFYAAMAAGSLAWATMTNGKLEAAARHGLTSVVISREMGDNAATTIALRELSLLLRYLDRPREATVLDGAFDALCQRYGVKPPPIFATIAADMEERLGRPDIADRGEREALLAQGASMTLLEAVDFVAEVLAERVALASG